MSLINGANLDVSSLGNIGGLFSGGGAAANALLKAGTSNLVPAVFGDKSSALVNALSSASGIKSSSATNLLAMVVPLILTFLKKFISDKGLNASSLSSLLASQGPNLQGALDSRFTSALGFASPTAFLGRARAAQATDAAKRAGAAIAGGAGAAANTRGRCDDGNRVGAFALDALGDRSGRIAIRCGICSAARRHRRRRRRRHLRRRLPHLPRRLRLRWS